MLLDTFDVQTVGSAGEFVKGNKDRYPVKILFYSSKKEDPGTGVEQSLATIVPEESIEAYRSIEELAQRLNQFYDHDTIAILKAKDREDLLNILSLHELLQDIRVVLLIPDQEVETIYLAHRIHPRFLGNSENDFSETMSILRKMLGYGD